MPGEPPVRCPAAAAERRARPHALGDIIAIITNNY